MAFSYPKSIRPLAEKLFSRGKISLPQLVAGGADKFFTGRALALHLRLLACGLAANVDGIEVDVGSLQDFRPEERREVREPLRVLHPGVEGDSVVQARGEGAVRPRLA